jgi:hypothetical protein
VDDVPDELSTPNPSAPSTVAMNPTTSDKTFLYIDIGVDDELDISDFNFDGFLIHEHLLPLQSEDRPPISSNRTVRPQPSPIFINAIYVVCIKSLMLHLIASCLGVLVASSNN